MHHPELGILIRFKVLCAAETDALVLEFWNEGSDAFTRAVLEAVIYNLKSDVSVALRKMSKPKAQKTLSILYNGCLMLNPGLDVEGWFQISNSPLLVSARAGTNNANNGTKPTTRRTSAAPKKKMTKQKYLDLEPYLKSKVVGQDEAITELMKALRRNQAGLGDEQRPVGVFIFAGPSGVGKSSLARELHNYIFGEGTEMVRVDCGEFQHKHENAKLLGAPPGYLGYDEGGQLAAKIAANPAAIVLLDEVEKAHPDVFHTFLRVLDDGIMTEASGKIIDFRDTLIIMTTNLGNGEIVSEQQHAPVGFSGKSVSNIPKRDAVLRSTKEALSKHFQPEFLNRIDKTIVFNHLTQENSLKIAGLELNYVQHKLEKRGCTLAFDDVALEAMVRYGIDHVQGARGLAQLRRDRIEDPLAELMLENRYPRGTVFQLTYDASDFKVIPERPVSNKRLPKKASSYPPRASSGVII